MTALPGALAAAQPVKTLGYVIEVDGNPRLALTPDEAAPLLGVPASTVRELCRTGKLRYRNLYPGSKNGRYLIPVAALINFLESPDG